MRFCNGFKESCIPSCSLCCGYGCMGCMIYCLLVPSEIINLLFKTLIFEVLKKISGRCTIMSLTFLFFKKAVISYFCSSSTLLNKIFSAIYRHQVIKSKYGRIKINHNKVNICIISFFSF